MINVITYPFPNFKSILGSKLNHVSKMGPILSKGLWLNSWNTSDNDLFSFFEDGGGTEGLALTGLVR